MLCSQKYLILLVPLQPNRVYKCIYVRVWYFIICIEWPIVKPWMFELCRNSLWRRYNLVLMVVSHWISLYMFLHELPLYNVQFRMLCSQKYLTLSVPLQPNRIYKCIYLRVWSFIICIEWPTVKAWMFELCRNWLWRRYNLVLMVRFTLNPPIYVPSRIALILRQISNA